MNKSIKNNLYIFGRAIGKMSPSNVVENPMIFMVWVAAMIASSILLKGIYLSTPNIYLFGQMTFWLWMTVFFSCIAESYAESKIPKDNYQKEKINFTKLVRKLNNKKDIENFKLVPHSKIKSGNYIYLQSGDEVPFDGVVVSGRCYVYESDITGELGDALKSPRGDNILIAGSDLLGEDDWLVIKVTFAKNKSFFAKASSILETIKRHSMPSEIALQRLIIGLSILFLSAIITVAVIAKYSGVQIPIIFLVDLSVLLLPTTISALQRSIITYAKARLAKNSIIVQDEIALDNAVDIQVALFDKTGTLTNGKREMIDFILLNDKYSDSYPYYLLLSSLDDNTHEGKSIVSYAHKIIKEEVEIDRDKYEFHHFTSGNPISGCEYGGIEIRKGSITAIAKYLKIKVKYLADELVEISDSIAKAQGTPVLFTVDKEIVGIIHLRDRFRKGIMKQLSLLQEEGISIRMITGDNELTASYAAQKLNMDDFYYDCTPEKKLAIIKDLQRQGYIVAMCGDGINDALALAQANIGVTFAENGKIHSFLSGNIVSKKHDITALIELKNMCRRMTVKRGALTVFSLASDISKYFVIVPALFTTAFPPLSILNFMNFQSLESVILASVMFNALVILALTPFVFHDNGWIKNKNSIWKNIILFGLGGIISPFLCIKLLDMFISYMGLV